MRETLTISVGGQEFRPENMPIEKLVQLLSGIADAIVSEGDASGVDTEGAEEGPAVSLTGVRGGSCYFDLSIDRRSVPVTKKIVSALQAGKLGSLSLPTQEAISTTLNRVTRDQPITLKLDSVDGAAFAMLPAAAPPLKVDRSNVTSGDTERMAVVISAGGLKPGGRVKMSSGEIVRVSANLMNTTKLGECLYKQVLMTGLAFWRLPDWKMVKFQARDIQPFPPFHADAALSELRVVHAEAFPDGLLDEYLADRAEESEE